MSKKIGFLLDTASSYNLEKKENCCILPINIFIEENGKENIYNENENITREEVYDFINKDNKIKTSQPILGVILEKMNEMISNYDLVIAIPFSKHLSNTFNTIKSCANQIDKNKILVLDSHPMSITGNWLVEEIEELNKQDVEINQKVLEKLAKKYRDSQCGVVIVNDLKRLIVGGRLSGIKGLLAKTLKLKLSIMYNGNLSLCTKDLTLEGAINKSIDEINKINNFKKLGIDRVVVFPDLEKQEDNEKCIEILKSKLKVSNVEYALLPTSVVTHTGTNTFSFIILSNIKNSNS